MFMKASVSDEVDEPLRHELKRLSLDVSSAPNWPPRLILLCIDPSNLPLILEMAKEDHGFRDVMKKVLHGHSSYDRLDGVDPGTFSSADEILKDELKELSLQFPHRGTDWKWPPRLVELCLAPENLPIIVQMAVEDYDFRDVMRQVLGRGHSAYCQLDGSPAGSLPIGHVGFLSISELCALSPRFREQVNLALSEGPAPPSGASPAMSGEALVDSGSESTIFYPPEGAPAVLDSPGREGVVPSTTSHNSAAFSGSDSSDSEVRSSALFLQSLTGPERELAERVKYLAYQSPGLNSRVRARALRFRYNRRRQGLRPLPFRVMRAELLALDPSFEGLSGRMYEVAHEAYLRALNDDDCADVSSSDSEGKSPGASGSGAVNQPAGDQQRASDEHLWVHHVYSNVD